MYTPHNAGCLLYTVQGIATEEAEEKLLTILKQVMEEKLTSTNIEVYIWRGELYIDHGERFYRFFFFADGVCIDGW